MESELLGHERGAFTGATNMHEGAFERAQRRHAYLSTRPASCRSICSRDCSERLENRRVRRASARQDRSRSICGSSPPPTATSCGTRSTAAGFRQDLCALGSRSRACPCRRCGSAEDLPLLIERASSRPRRAARPPRPAPETIDLMMKHDWPGNVREAPQRDRARRAPRRVTRQRGLAAPRARAAARSEPSSVTPSRTATSAEASMTVPVDVSIPFKPAAGQPISEFERRHLAPALAATATSRPPRAPRDRSDVDPQDAAPAGPGEPQPRLKRCLQNARRDARGGVNSRLGVHCWVDIWAIPAAADWEAEIRNALEGCVACIVVLGPNGWGPYHLAEARLALERRGRDPLFVVVPVLLPGAKNEDKTRLEEFSIAPNG